MRSRGTVILSLAFLVCAVAVYAWATVPPLMAQTSEMAPSAGLIDFGQPGNECSSAHWSVVRINCKKGSSASAIGNYGGADFSVSCTDGGAASMTICNDTFAYSFDINNKTSESCHYTGDRIAVSVKCGNVQLRIN